MRIPILKLLVYSLLTTGYLSMYAQEGAFDAPDGGWDYIYNGDQDTYGAADSGFTSLDGNWSHDNGSDQWDGSGLGGDFGAGNGPGGVQVITEGGVTYLRIQDTGDPRDYGMPDPSNRKVYLGYDLSANGAPDTVMDDGVTLYFRARVPTDGPLDPLHPDGQSANGTQPYPGSGDGYVTSDGGKGNFVIKQAAGGAIAFSLTTSTDTPGGDPNSNITEFSGLSMNEFAGNQVSGSVNFGQGEGKNIIPFDPTQWHEFWITIKRDEANVGTHIAAIYMDGDPAPRVFKMTAGTGSDYAGSYLAMGSTATPQSSALDIDWFGYKLAAVPPKPKSFQAPTGGWDYIYNGDQDTYGAADSGFTSLDGNWSHDNGSDQWDGSGIGGDFGAGNGPGGAQVIEEGGVTYLRIQDTGDPRDYEMPDPSNRKVYLGYDLSANGAPDAVMDDGVTLYFRARVPTSGPLDPLHPDGQAANGTQPYPEGGDGYVTSDGGKGNFVIKQAAGGAIAFSLTTSTDTPGGDPTSNITEFSGLSMNEFAGNQISGSVNFGQGEGKNIIPFDPTQWHEFWITIKRDEANVGTHIASIYMDGDPAPRVFKMTAGTGSDYGGSYLAMGSTATPQSSALDIDFFGYKLGTVEPTGATGDLPDFVDLSPRIGASFVDPAVGVSFVATSTGSIPREKIQVILNGVDFSSQLQITGNEQRWDVKLTALQPNQVYSGRLIIGEAGGATIESILSFDTFKSDYLVFEAEDYNFEGGRFIDDIVVSSTPAANNYLDQLGTEGIDYHQIPGTGENYYYRIFDVVGTEPTLDAPRAKFDGVPDIDSNVGWTVPEEWLNYTRTLPQGRYAILGRLASANAAGFTAQVDLVTAGATTVNQTLQPVGLMSSPSATGGWQSYRYFYARDDDGQIALFDANGVTTIRVTVAEGAFNSNFYMLIPESDVPQDPVPGADPATLIISSGNGQVTLSWDGGGTLESASTVSGPWNAVAGASSPFNATTNGSASYFRVRN